MSSTPVERPKRRMLAAAISTALITTAVQAAEDSTLEEVVVWGRFQQSLVNRIPISPEEFPFTLNILGREFLEERNFTRPIEALTTLPNIMRVEDRQGTGTAFFLSRGFAAPILVDNRTQGGIRGSGARDDSFVERYEVLKGPASISLGPVGAGGVINTVTKVPEVDRALGIKLRTDQFGSVGGELDANMGEIGSGVMLRVNGAYRDFGFDADETKRETLAIRPVVTADIGPATSVRASVAYTEHTLNPNPGFPLLSNGEIPNQIDTDTFTGFDNGEGEVEDLLYDLEANHEFLDNLKLTVRGSKQESDFTYNNTSGLYNYNYADGGPGIGLNDPYVYSYTGGGEIESENTFYDAQLAYQAQVWGQRQDVVVGVAYDESAFQRDFSAFPLVGPISLDEIDEPRRGPSDFGLLSPFTISDSELNSLFAEAALRPNDRLTINAGVRYDELEQLTVNFRRGMAIEAPYDDDEVTFRLGVSGEVSHSLNAYASYAQAFSPQFGVKRGNDPVKAETSEGFELGLKGKALGDRVSFEAGVFHTTREDIAVSDPSNDRAAGEFFVITVGEVELQGFEFTGNLNPLAGLNVNASVGYTDIDVIEAGDDEVSEPVFPEVTGSVYVSYQLQSGTLQGLSLGGGARYVGEREGPYTDYDSYTIADINISYPIKENMTVAVDILNVSDEFYLENAASFAQNLSGGSVLGPPRTAVLTLRTQF